MTPETMRTFDSSLPIDEALPRLTAALGASNCAVLVAPPGAGKTTRVPLVLLDEAWAQENGKAKKILVLEPRRLAARAAASAWRDARRTGWRHGRLARALRLEDFQAHAHRGGDRGRVHAAGAHDPALDGIASVLFDEFHERALEADLGLALEARDVLQGLRDDLESW